MLGGGNESFEMSERTVATAFGGLGLLHRLVRQVGLPKLIDAAVQVFKGPSPYRVSDHVLNLTYNVVCGGKTLDDLEGLRHDEAYMNALGATRLPDPTTAGDFLRRLDRGHIDNLSEAINEARTRIWKKNKPSFFELAVIDVDGTIAGTQGECKEGMDMSYKGIWGYAPLVVSLSNTGEILYTRNRSGNRPSHDGCFEYLDPAVEVVRDAGFKRVRLRGDCHFSLTEDFDYWTKNKVEFVFGVAGHPKLVELADGLEEGEWRRLKRKSRTASPCRRGQRKPRVKKRIIEERLQEPRARARGVRRADLSAGEVLAAVPLGGLAQDDQRDAGAGAADAGGALPLLHHQRAQVGAELAPGDPQRERALQSGEPDRADQERRARDAHAVRHAACERRVHGDRLPRVELEAVGRTAVAGSRAR